MKLGFSVTNLLRYYSSLETIDIVARAGIDCIDFPFYEKNLAEPWPFMEESAALSRAEELKKYAADKGVSFHQAHEPFAFALEGDKLKCMRCAAALGCKYFVMHPGLAMSYEDFMAAPYKETEILSEYFNGLAELLRDLGLKGGVENIFCYDSKRGLVYKGAMATPEIHKAVAQSHPDLCACLDVGHANIAGVPPEEAVEILDSSLEVLHVHDSRDRAFEHTLPYLGSINWDALAAALKRIGFKGVFSFETNNFMAAYPPQLMPAAVKLNAEIGRFLCAKIEG